MVATWRCFWNGAGVTTCCASWCDVVQRTSCGSADGSKLVQREGQRRVCRSDGWRSGRVHPRLAATTFHHGRVRSAVCQRCGGRGSLRLYENTYTLACGFGEGLGLGSDVKAAIMRRGLLEIAGFLEEFLPADHPGAMSAQSVFLELCGRAPCCIFGEPQRAVVGDTFPLGYKFSAKIALAEFLKENPDRHHPVYSTEHGVYEPGCGLSNVTMTYGHDEYMYNVLVGHGCPIPEEDLYMIRFHCFSFPLGTMFPGRNAFSRPLKWVSSWQKDLRVVFILHVHVLTGDVLCGASPGYFPLYVVHPIHTSCVHISIKLCGYRIPRARPRRLFERPDHLTKIDTLRHCCDQKRTSSLTQTQSCFDITQDAGFVVVPRQSRRMTQQFRWPRQRGQWTAET